MYNMNKGKETEFILPHILIMTLFALLIVSLLSSVNAMKPSINTMTTVTTSILQLGNYLSLQDNVINVGSASRAKVIVDNTTLNTTNSTNNSSLPSLIGKTEVSNLPNIRALPPGSPAHLIPFHPKDPSAFSAAKKRAELGLTNSS